MNNAASSVVDVSEYANLDNILDRPSLHCTENFELVKNVVKIGHAHSKSGIQYNIDLAEYIDRWEKIVDCSPKGIVFNFDAYTSYVTITANSFAAADCKRCRERELGFMKRTIPISYVIWGAVCLSFAVVFAVMMLYGRWTGNYIIDPIINFALCVASIGLTITVIIAIVDWRQRLNGKKEKKQGKR